jgi:MFS transporter, DHA1 family, multidrug resistance protein
MSSAARQLAGWIGIDRLLLWAALVACFGAVLTTILTTVTPDRPWALAGPMVVVLVGVGAVIPTCQAGLLRLVRDNPGNASGLFFFLQMISGASYTAVINLKSPESITTIGLLVAAPAMLLLALCCLGDERDTAKRGRRGVTVY